MQTLNHPSSQPRSLCAAVVGLAIFIAPMVDLRAATTETVNCNAPGRDLQKKLDEAEEGTTLIVSGNCSNGPFVLRRDVNLSGGTGGAVLSSTTGGTAVLVINGARTVISWITVDAVGAGTGIILNGASADLFHVTARNAGGSGLQVNNGSSVTIQDGSDFRDNGFAGVNIALASSAEISNSTFEDNGVGINVTASSGATVGSGNTIAENGVGLIIDKNSAAFLIDSSITDNIDYGILVSKQGFLQTFSPPSTISGNGTDVFCDARGIIEIDTPQNGGGTTSIHASCIQLGAIF